MLEVNFCSVCKKEACGTVDVLNYESINSPWPRMFYEGSLLLRPQIIGSGFNRRDVHSLCRFKYDGIKCGTKIPRGIGQLKALHTLMGVNVTWDMGNATVKQFRELTELRRLGLFGISNKNSMEFWSATAAHSHLRTLIVEWDEYTEQDCLDGFLGEGLSPPSWLERLDLSGKLVRVADWIPQLQNLCMLVLNSSSLEKEDAMQALGVLPNLAVLHVEYNAFLGEQLHFQNSSFLSLVELAHFALLDLESVLFEEDAMPRLELLLIDCCTSLKEISGLSVLTSLKEIRLGNNIGNVSMEQILSGLGEDQKHVNVNVVT